MCLAQGPQRSDAGEARTRGPSVSSQALYHWATALPYPIIAKTFYKLLFSTFLYMNFSFQHIKHYLNDLDIICSNVKKT